MVDFGLLGLFALQCAMVFLCYVAYDRISKKISTLNQLEKKLDAIPAQLAPWEARFEAMAGRIGQVEQAPAAHKRRFEEAEDRMASTDRKVAHLETKLASTAARVSSSARWTKRAKEEDDTDPAPEGEGNDGTQVPMFPPGSHPQETPVSPAISPGFGVVKRRAG